MLEPAKAAGLPLALGLIDRSPLFPPYFSLLLLPLRRC